MAEALTFENQLVADPIKGYADLHSRILRFGQNAPIPEFKPTVEHHLNVLEGSKTKDFLKQHPDLRYEHNEALTYLAHTNLTFQVDDPARYPYAVPFKDPFPYRATIDALESAVRLEDKIERLTPGSRAVPLYHFDRYTYHRHTVVSDPDAVVIPTAQDQGFYPFIRTRSVPMFFVGMFSDVKRVDRHYQSQLDNTYHDFNHARRQLGYMHRRMEEMGLTTQADKMTYYQDMDSFILDKIVPNVVALPKGSSFDDIAIRRLMRVIFFEILHETALTAEKESIVKDLLRPAGPQPFEHMVAPGKKAPDNIEELRTPTGNLKSGISIIGSGNEEPVEVHYVYDRALGLLANVYNKLTRSFYDDSDNPSKFVAPVEHRRPHFVVQAARNILNALDVTDAPNDETLLGFVTSREGSEEKFVYKGLAEEDVPTQSATDPLPADDLITQVKALGKRVHTLFGFSKLGYQNRASVMGAIESELDELDRDSTVISIGATEEGIGEAYTIAKRLGFQTIGIVSTQALSYSGRFSPDVDKIFIVNDHHWGGYIPGTEQLTDATRAFLETSDSISAYGGGKNTAITLEHALDRGIPVKYTPAEMNHEIAQEEAEATATKGELDFKGSAYHTWNRISNP